MMVRFKAAHEHSPKSYSAKKHWFAWERRAKDLEQKYLATVAIGDTWRKSRMHKTPESYHFSRIVAIRNYARSKEGAKREKIYEELFSMSHRWPFPWVDRARKAFREGDNELAYEYSAQAAQYTTGEWWIYRGLIHLAMNEKRYEDAIIYIERVETMPVGTKEKANREAELKTWAGFKKRAMEHIK